MPRRTRSHVIGDIAVSRVASICNELGWACEPVQKDYGEDLWLQTTIGEKVDHHRIWFQVKATDNIERYKNRRGEINYVVDLNHALRWVRSLELVVFILWDVKNDIGYWTIPKDNVTDWDLWESKGKTSKLMFNKKSKFDVSSAEKLSWIARISFYNSLLAQAQQAGIQYEREKNLGLSTPRNSHERLNLISFDFLRTIGFFKDDGSVDKHIGKQIVKEMEKGLATRPEMSDSELCLRSVVLVVLGRINKLCGDGLPGSLLWESVRFGASIILSRLEDAGLINLRQILAKRHNN